ncbi:hypothetical protein QM467_04885 [Rhodoblastus sp. 17X3]|uniref:hypothetical protein n=1 Tax=Rhodoblastus sp. 17X3 TaxID=3047026 RepID=UPI0024B768EE|nr:hypothetical protein [Rhodoblastus sp. 17X3]MDI9847396.1 hypothetical protein [Rhodoblastus sp. 17X3]
MIDHENLVRAAAAEDAARVLDRAARDILRVAGRLDDISANTIERVAAQLRTIAKLKRPKGRPAPVAAPQDVAGSL